MRSALEAELAWLDLRIAQETRRLRARYELSLDEFRGLYVSDEQVDALLVDVDSDPLPPPMPEPQPGGRLALVCERFGLDAPSRGVLVLALAPELDRKYETLFAYLNDDVTRRWPTADLAIRLLGDPRPTREALFESSVAMRAKLIAAVAETTQRPQLLRGFLPSEPLTRFVLGSAPALSAGLEFAKAPEGAAGPLEAVVSIYRTGVDRHALALVGSPGSGRKRAASALAAKLERPLLVVDLAAAPNPLEALDAARLVGTLEGAATYVDGIEEISPPERADRALFAQAIRALAGPVLIAVGPERRGLDALETTEIVEVTFGEPTSVERRDRWSAALSRAQASARSDDVAAVADRFRLGAGAIDRASRSAAMAARLAGVTDAIPLAALCHAAAAEGGAALRRLASPTPKLFGWDDLVLPPDTLTRVRAVADAIANRARVQEDWGLGRFSGAGGLAVLFQGPSGAGKTMTASVLASALGLDLYRIELAGVVSKYIGETEKNLERIFAAARRSNAMLLFDEADALFGKRSEVKDAHDRYANLEVAYLLQRMEEHDGVTILTTNLSRNMDQAFSRRLQHVIEFPRPDAAARVSLWQGMLRPPLPVAPEVDVLALAQAFELTGGEIRKAALEAAYLAAAGDGSVTMAALAGAAARESRRQGRMAPETLGGRPFAFRDVA